MLSNGEVDVRILVRDLENNLESVGYQLSTQGTPSNQGITPFSIGVKTFPENKSYPKEMSIASKSIMKTNRERWVSS